MNQKQSEKKWYENAGALDGVQMSKTFLKDHQ
jgi:hypothetical protein